MKNSGSAGISVIHELLRSSPRRLLAPLLLFVLVGCDVQQEVKSWKSTNETERLWVYVQLNVPEQEGLQDYYYYARMAAGQYKQVSQNQVARGFLLLTDVRYYGDDKKFHAYEDEKETGDLVFRLEDVRRVRLLKKPPSIEKDSESSPVDKPTDEVAPESSPAKKSSDARPVGK